MKCFELAVKFTVPSKCSADFMTLVSENWNLIIPDPTGSGSTTLDSAILKTKNFTKNNMIFILGKPVSGRHLGSYLVPTYQPYIICLMI